ncbi:type II secretion system protein GspJ [Phaeobacter sp. PT47_59]|uniref:type II secretion system protein GspJ n=1 Tax=Phaeobacter sp. PT47_59 TaxID=3029979 RepID=UPI002380886A|nr:type II secretion system protein GspJ [Phaeobacter sp. PT47_59]MDE4175217.1 type II secretion system protein GspJ [Phaeobacter sp. PT47_59]
MRRLGPQNTSDRGLSLIELVVAMAIFALVAVMGTQALTGMLRMRDALTLRAEQSATLAQGISLLRADLSAMVPMLFYPPGRAAPRSALSFSGPSGTRDLALSRGGAQRPQEITATVATAGLGLQRVEWQLRQGQLSRRIWPALMPARATALSPAMPVLQGVRDLRLRSYWTGVGWITGTDPGGLVPQQITGGQATDADSGPSAIEAYSDRLPLAVELVIETEDFGEITLVETLK